MKSLWLMALCLTAGVVSETAHAAALRCTPDAGQPIFFIKDAAQAGSSEVTVQDRFHVIVDGGGRPDIVWNREHWGFRSARAGSIDVNFLQGSDMGGNFGLVGGGAIPSYLLPVNADDAEVRRYVLRPSWATTS